MKLRAWQQQALRKYTESDSKVFFLQACPGAGKTKFTLTALRQELEKRGKDRTFIIVVAPSSNLKDSWMREAHDFGIELCTRASDGAFPGGPNYLGTVITYQALGSYLPLVKQWQRQAGYKFILVCDEIHHASISNSWGNDSIEYGELCDKIIFLSGTPYRTDRHKIPLANYENDLLVVDYEYTTRQARVDQVRRKIEFRFGAFETASQILSTGELFTYDSESVTEDKESRVLRAALGTSLKLAADMIKIAWRSLQEMRSSGDDNAACLVRCLAGEKVSDEEGYISRVTRLIKEITGCGSDEIEVVHSKVVNSTDRINLFKNSKKMFLVSIRQISEGVDIPRLRVLLHLDNTKTELTLRQEVGRIARWEDEQGKNQYAIMVMPNIPTYMQFAKCVEDEEPGTVVKEYENQESEERCSPGEEKERLVTLYAELTGISSVMSGQVHNHDDPLMKEAQAIKSDPTLGDISLELICMLLQAQARITKNNDDEFSREKLDALNEIPLFKTIPNDELSKRLRKELSKSVGRVMRTTKRFKEYKDVYNKIYELYPLNMPDYLKCPTIDYVERKYGIDGLKRCLSIARELMAVPA